MSDLVNRLRNYSGDTMLCDDYADAMQEAADEIERLRKASVALWMLLDDIDTIDDACKGNDVRFRNWTREIQRKRFKIMDGDAIDAAMQAKEQA